MRFSKNRSRGTRKRRDRVSMSAVAPTEPPAPVPVSSGRGDLDMLLTLQHLRLAFGPLYSKTQQRVQPACSSRMIFFAPADGTVHPRAGAPPVAPSAAPVNNGLVIL